MKIIERNSVSKGGMTLLPSIINPLVVGILAASPAGFSQAESFQLEEVIVTATRRAQSAQEIPYNIAAIGGEDLENTGITNGSDLLQQVPGIFVSDVGGRSSINSNISIRGINANNPGNNSIVQNLTESSVSTYVNDTPMFINISLSDVERVEMLRGPQGTLYGSGSVGGAVRYIFNKPDVEAFSSSISGRVSTSEESDDVSYETNFILNAPLADGVALRLVGGYEELGGFIDARHLYARESDGSPTPSGDYLTSGPVIGPKKEDTDGSDSWNVRAALHVDLSDSSSALLTVAHQEDTFDGDSIRRITDLESNNGPEYVHDIDSLSFGEAESDLVSLELSFDLGFATLTSSTAHTEIEVDNSINSTEIYVGIEQDTGFYSGYPRISTISTVIATDEVFTQEFRLVSQGESNIDWVVGAFHKDQERGSLFADEMVGFNDWLIAGGAAADPFGYAPVSNPSYVDIPIEIARSVSFKDMALFGELTYHITDQWQLTGGARFFKQDFEQDVRVRLPYCSVWCADDGEDLLGTSTSSSQKDFQDSIFKINTSYQMTEDHMAYFTWSQGFRHGGANAIPFNEDASLNAYDADTLDNYEVGLKGYLADNSVSYTLSLFRSNWDDIQLDAFVGPLLTPAALNGEGARSQGLELDVKANLSENLVVSVGYTYTDAELTDDAVLAGVTAEKGDGIPGVSKQGISLFADYTLPLSDSEIIFHADASYRSDFETSFNSSFGNYAKLDGYEVVNVAVNWITEKFTVGGYINNLTNEEGVTATSTELAGALAESGFAYVMRPRTLGISATYRFE
ncbi:TonB-dependent receptor [Pseudomaricurvus alkylphenolicus]|uniref:TonB-dependent receptor n=1 Tax=Pseudomaricurvus alkylphenolicus TaxID=1306991 RepID=UPI0014227163|nr:TonB-dependent receptor [Pseudomaricurvus alkylphenolicus]NIB38402.1 TonB-dependent receptor [Pseudomaricurvus alkylphenolicus]